MKREKQAWRATKIPNLFQLDGVYYLRFKPQSQKQTRKSLHTSDFHVARQRLRGELLKMGKAPAVASAGTWSALIEPWRQWLDGERTLGHVTQSTIDYKEELIANICKTWPNWRTFPLSRCDEKLTREWMVAHCGKRTPGGPPKYSPTRTNGAVTVLRELLDIAKRDKVMTPEDVEDAKRGLKFVEVDYDYKRMTMQLPEPAQVVALRLELYRRCKVRGTLGGYLFDFLLFSGCRIDSAGSVLRKDVYRSKGLLYFRQAKYGAYTIPLFPELLALIDKIEKEIPGGPQDRLLPTKSLQRVLTSSCLHLGINHLSHHDLRHIFATRCIEAGVDIPTLASWLGHKDGGRTCMMIYGHLRQTHSQAQAATMKFL